MGWSCPEITTQAGLAVDGRTGEVRLSLQALWILAGEFQPSNTGGLRFCFDLNVTMPGHSVLEQESIEPVLCFLQEPIIMRP